MKTGCILKNYGPHAIRNLRRWYQYSKLHRKICCYILCTPRIQTGRSGSASATYRLEAKSWRDEVSGRNAVDHVNNIGALDSSAFLNLYATPVEGPKMIRPVEGPGIH